MFFPLEKKCEKVGILAYVTTGRLIDTELLALENEVLVRITLKKAVCNLNRLLFVLTSL